MILTINKKHDDIISKILLVILCAWPLFFITKGIDYMDSGFYLSHYKYYFDGCINIAAATELSDFFGALFYKLLPDAKFLGFRVLDWIANCITWIFVYKIGSRSLPKTWSALAVLIGSIFVRRFPMMLSYNTFSVLLLSIAMYYLQKGIINKDNKSIIISGVIIGFNVFFRLPNSLQCIYVIVPLISLLSLNKEDIKIHAKFALKQCLYFTIAGFIGLFIGFAICVIFKGLSGTINSIGLTLSLLDEGRHTTSFMMDRINKEYNYFKQYIFNIAKYPLYMLGTGLVFGLVRIFIKDRRILIFSLVGLILAIIKICSVTVDNLKYIVNITVLAPYFISLIVSVISLAFIYKNREAFITSLMFILLMLIFPIGTDNGIMHSCIFMYIILLNILVSLNGYKIKNHKINLVVQSIFTVFAIVIMITFGIGGTKNILLAQSYNDGSYNRQNYYVDIPELWGMQTVDTRAKAIKSLYDELESAEKYKDRELLMLGNCSLIYTITDYKPFGREVWADLEHVDKDKIFKQLENSEKKPIVLIEDLDNLQHSVNYASHARANELCTKLGYSKVEREFFTIYYPSN